MPKPRETNSYCDNHVTKFVHSQRSQYFVAVSSVPRHGSWLRSVFVFASLELAWKCLSRNQFFHQLSFYGHRRLSVCSSYAATFSPLLPVAQNSSQDHDSQTIFGLKILKSNRLVISPNHVAFYRRRASEIQLYEWTKSKIEISGRRCMYVHPLHITRQAWRNAREKIVLSKVLESLGYKLVWFKTLYEHEIGALQFALSVSLLCVPRDCSWFCGAL